MNWETIFFAVVIYIGYSYLLKTIKKRSIIGSVKLYVESSENTKGISLNNKSEIYSKSCPFIVTPVPGMEFMAAGIDGVFIKRVITDENGLLEVICFVKLSLEQNEYSNACECLESEGWRKQVNV